MTRFSPDALRSAIAPLVTEVYPDRSDDVVDGLLDLARQWAPAVGTSPHSRPDESTAYLITYGDAVRRTGEPPLRTLAGVLDEFVGDSISDVHLLPIYPWTSDDGFGVVDHRLVNPELGSWEDVQDLAGSYRVALDFVANHVSASSPWFRGWLAGDPQYDGFFLAPGPEFDAGSVVRPRVTPLLHSYDRPRGGPVRAWTTFGPDQVDIDPSTPQVLLELTDVLLGYLARGARTIRLDAVGYLWKASGTSCIHLPQTHAIVRIWRAVVDALAPGTLLLTETNVPHADNISYFGDGSDEANMVYQFALPPLVLHAFITGRATVLAGWAATVEPVSDTATWFNFLASHDGIGLRPSIGLLTDEDRALLVDRTLRRGGRVSMARQADGTETVYELNTNFLDALVDPSDPDPDASAVIRGLAAHVLLLSVVGVPAIYHHSFFGSGQDLAGLRASGMARRINREVLDADRLADDVRSSARRSGMIAGLRTLLDVRRTLPGLSPFATQHVDVLDDRVLVVRRAAGTPDEVVAAINVSDQTVPLPALGGFDAISGRHVEALSLPPFGYAWLVAESMREELG